MRHRVNSMMVSDSASTSKSEDVWFVDFGASHHMTSHQEWFRDLRTPDRPGYIKTGDDTLYPIGTSVMSHSGKKVTKLA